jgi:hypothetical protein
MAKKAAKPPKPLDLKKLGVKLEDFELKPELTPQEISGQQKKKKREIQKFINTFILALSLGIVIGAILFFVKDAKLAIAGGGGILVLLMSINYPYLAIWAFTIYMPFSGTITYWIGGGNALFQLAKDGFAFPAYYPIYQEFKKKKILFWMPQGLSKSLLILLVFLFLTFLSSNVTQQFSNKPEGKPILMAIIGFKILLGYIPLLSCTYSLLKTKVQLVWFTRLHVLLAIACCLLGVLQYQMLASGACQGTDHLIGEDLFKATLEYKCLVGGSLVFSPSQNMIRLPGTFVAPWQWAWFLIGNTFTTFATTFSDPAIKWRGIGFLGLTLVFVNAMVSGQRIALLLVPVITIGLLVLTGQLAKPKTFIPIVGGIAILIFASFILFPDIIQERIDSTISRWNASPPTDFIADQAGHSTGQFKPLGNGVARATNSARVFGEAALIETYYPKLIYELGLGTLAYVGVLSIITISTFKAYRSLKDKDLRSYGASFWVFIFFISYQTYYYPLDVDPVAVYYWMFAGLILRLPEIDRQESERRQKALDKIRGLLESKQLKAYMKQVEKDRMRKR